MLQTVRAEADTVHALKLVLRHLPAIASVGYARHVYGHLQEVLSEMQLAAALESTPLPP